MKKIVFFLLLFSLQKATAQRIINMEASGNASDKSVSINKKIKVDNNRFNKSLIPGEQYQIKISGVNSAHTSLKVKAKSKEIYTPIPDVVKTILPGITGNLSVNNGAFVATTQKNLFSKVDSIVKHLNIIKKKAEELHELSLFKPDIPKANDFYKDIFNLYNNKIKNEAELIDTVFAEIQFLTVLKDIGESSIQNNPSLEPNVIEGLARINMIANELKEHDYHMFFQYIDRSRKADNFVKSKSFKAEKDLVELNLILVNTFTKDTLVNETRTLYTKGGSSVGLSFSTGFFYTEMFSDQSYYLKDRPDETKTLLPERRTVSDISIGGLGHIYYKISPFIRVGPAMGLAISPFDGKSRYLLGGSLLLGREKMFGLTVGSAWAKVKELSAAVSTDEQGQFLPKGTTTIPTIDRIRSKMFVGLTYNLASTRK